MSNIWDDPDMQPSGNYMKFEKEGDTVSGTIRAVRKHTFADGNTAAELLLTTDDGEEVTVTAGQVRLAARLAELRPAEGDRIGIRFDRSEKRDGGKTLKHFTVQVGNADAAPAAEAAPAPAAQPPAADSLI